ncbi:MAG: 2-dehydropantoate 2-reductase N-terminal domain-containing protein [Pseudomonadota bacterium]|nr:2-dehydropantoate 2-reductase N-terminal domain-containing protein [Pseudomonadota bacterium]
MRIAIFGTGANGSCTAADLIRSGHDVILIDQWPQHVEKMRVEGLTINFPDEVINVQVNAYHLCDVCTLNMEFDYIFIMVKAYDTRWAAQFIAPHLTSDGIMVGIQNAMTAEDIADVAGRDRTIGCVVELSSEIFTPGLVQRNTSREKTWFGLGALDDFMSHRVDEVQAILQNVGKVSKTDHILSAKWMKLIINSMCLGPLAMLGLTLYEAMKIPGVREFILKAGAESLALGQDKGFTIQPIFGLNQEDVKDTNHLLETLFDKLAADIGPSARDCVLQDHIKERYSEVDMINGLVAEESESHGRLAPANKSIAEITKRIQNKELNPDPANLKLAIELMNQ